jgi:hypothetical protein
MGGGVGTNPEAWKIISSDPETWEIKEDSPETRKITTISILQLAHGGWKFNSGHIGIRAMYIIIP